MNVEELKNTIKEKLTKAKEAAVIFNTQLEETEILINEYQEANDIDSQDDDEVTNVIASECDELRSALLPHQIDDLIKQSAAIE